MGIVHIAVIPLLLLPLFATAYTQRPTLNDVSTIINSYGYWKLRLPERFIRNQILPFIQQFRRQLNPQTEITWLRQDAQGVGNFYYPSQGAKSTHIDLDPPEQRAYRNGPASTRSDLGGMIVREMWNKAKAHCLSCGRNGSRQCILREPNCGLPYQLFDEDAQQIYCSAILYKLQGRIQLRAKMECQIYPDRQAGWGGNHFVLAQNYQKNWRLMCVNCDPSVLQQGMLLNGQPAPLAIGNGANWHIPNGGADVDDFYSDNDSDWAESFVNGHQQRRGVIRIRTDQKYSRIYQINQMEGREIARLINHVRAKIANGETPNLPVASGMNQIKWKHALTSEAQKQLYTRDNDPVNIVDLEFPYLIPGAQQQQQRGRQQQQQGHGVISRGTNYVDLDAPSLLLWTVRNYLEMFANRQGLDCSVHGVCKATCRKGSIRTRVNPWQRMAENPADYHCYPYELLYDRAHSIGCAVRFITRQRTHLQAKLVCVIEHQYGRHGSVRRMMHRHNVYKVGTACSHCENTHHCDSRTKLCVPTNWQQRGYEPINQVLIGEDGFGMGGQIGGGQNGIGIGQFVARNGRRRKGFGNGLINGNGFNNGIDNGNGFINDNGGLVQGRFGMNGRQQQQGFGLGQQQQQQGWGMDVANGVNAFGAGAGYQAIPIDVGAK